VKTASLVVGSFVVFSQGCGATATPKNDTPVIAEMACETARMATVLRGKIAPSPTPAVDLCERCRGTGVLGDGATIRMTCADCKGTGLKLKSVLTGSAGQ